MNSDLKKIVFFDLGKVLLQYDFGIAARRLCELTGLDGKAILDATLAEPTPICEAIETDRMTSEDLYLWVCQTFGMTLPRNAFEAAHRDIFTPMPESWQLVRDLKAAGVRLGILSNICQVHWDFCARTFPELFGLFDLPLSSAGLKARKPGPEIFVRAAERAEVLPENVFFFDDRSENVAGARTAGWDAILFTTGAEARNALRERGFSV